MRVHAKNRRTHALIQPIEYPRAVHAVGIIRIIRPDEQQPIPKAELRVHHASGRVASDEVLRESECTAEPRRRGCRVGVTQRRKESRFSYGGIHHDILMVSHNPTMRTALFILFVASAAACPAVSHAAPDTTASSHTPTSTATPTSTGPTATPSGAVLTPARVFASPDLSGPRARGLAMAPDGSAVTFLKAKDTDVTVTDLWIADVAGGNPRLLIDGAALAPKGHALSESEKSLRERKGIQTHGVVDYAWDEEGRYIVVPVEGQLWLYERAGGQIRQLTQSAATDSDAKVSPKGRYVSFVRDDNLLIIPTAGGAERPLTSDGTDSKSWGTAEFIAQEELDRRTGYWWSPDETHIALTYVDQSGVDVIDRPEINATGATIVHQRYPRAGRPNARVELHVLDVATLARTRVDLGADPDVYLARVDWSKDGRTLYVQRLSRDQRRLDLLAVDPATGTARVILTELSPHWVDATNDFTPLHDGSFLWTSERSGYRHLYLYAADGHLLNQLTHGDWPVDAVEGVDETRGVALIGASRDDPTERRLYTVSWRKAREPVALTPGGGWWTAVVAEHGGSYAATFSGPATPPQTALYDAKGQRVRWIEENRLDASHPYYPYLSRHQPPTFGQLAAADGQTLYWSMRTPPGFNPAQRYPVIVKVYGGPAGALVTRAWPNPEDQLLLEAGFILFSLDNRGTPNRSVAFKTALDRRFGTVEVEDQLAGVRSSQIPAVYRSASHRRRRLVQRRLHDDAAAHGPRLTLRRGRRRRAGHGFCALRHRLHRTLHGHPGE